MVCLGRFFGTRARDSNKWWAVVMVEMIPIREVIWGERGRLELIN